MTTVEIPMQRCWAPVERPWRHVVAGDVIVGDVEDGPRLWLVAEAGEDYCQVHGVEGTYDMDPDELVTVLVPAVERDGMAVLGPLGVQVAGGTEIRESG